MDIQTIFNRLKADCIKEPSELSEDILRSYALDIYTFYTDNKHHIRSPIAQYVSRHSNCPDSVSEFSWVLLKVLEYIRPQEALFHTSHAVGYFYDYLTLESHHLINRVQIRDEIKEYLSDEFTRESDSFQATIYTHTSKVKSDLHALRKDLEETLTTYTTTQKQELASALTEHTNTLKRATQDEIHNKMHDLDTHSITVLGIFTAVSFVFSGSFTLVGSALSSLHSMTPYSSFLLIAVLCLLSAIIVDSICVIIWGLAKFLNKTISTKFAKCFGISLNVALLLIFLICFSIYVGWGIISTDSTAIDRIQSSTPTPPTQFVMSIALTDTATPANLATPTP